MPSILELYSGPGSITIADTQLYTFGNVANVDEKKILIALHQGNADDIAFTDNTFTKEDIGAGIDDEVMVTNELPESSTIMSLKFNPGNGWVEGKKSADLVYSNNGVDLCDPLTSDPLILVTPGTTLEHTVKNNTMELGDDTAPLYVGHLKFEFTDGSSVYDSVPNGHRIALDTTDTDYNYFKAANSVLSNLDSNPTNGIQGGFDNTFNSTDAFYTENIISRDATSNQLIAGTSLVNAGIRSSTGNTNNTEYNGLTVSILPNSSDNVPFFGSLKIVQDALSVSYDVNHNTNDNSTMSRVASNADLNQVPIAISAPPRDMQETEFKALFNNADLAKVGPGYTFDLVIGAQQLGGYALGSENTVSIPMYNDSNLPDSQADVVQMFALDDTAIHENLRYMMEMKEKTLFGSHKFNIKNGTLQKDVNQRANKNYSDFTVLDGAESLRVITANGISDLETSGIIKVIGTNNTLGDGNARYTKTGDNANVNRLIVNYEAVEPDYLSAVGYLNTELQDNYFVKSKIAVLAKSTNTVDDQWTADSDVAMSDDSALVFQSTPDSTLFGKNNISAYSASQLATEVDSDHFALISLKKFYDLSSSYAESPMFKTADNTALPVTSSIRLSDMKLNEISIDDLRVNLTCKKGSEMPSITPLTNSPQSSWKTSSSETSDVSSAMGKNNNNYLISQKGGKTLLGPDIYKMMNQQNPLNPLNVKIELTTNKHSVENRDILELKAFVTLNLPSGVSSAASAFAAAAFAAATAFASVASSLTIGPPAAGDAANAFQTAATEFRIAGFNAAATAFQTAADAFASISITNINTDASNAISAAANAKTIYDAAAAPIINKTVEVDEKDLVFQPIGEPSDIDSVVTGLSGLTGWLTSSANYEVKQTVTTKEYSACIRVKIGAYKNLWHVTRVNEEITWYTLFDKNQAKVLPDHYLSQIKRDGDQAFKTTSRFIATDNSKIFKIGSTSEFTVAHLMGFKVGVEKCVSYPTPVWTAFTLEADSYDNSADLMYDQATTVSLTTSAGIFGDLTLSIDSPKQLALGSESDKSGGSDPMYMINLSIPKGNTTFTAVGYKYSIANDSRYFNSNWSPYAGDNELFLKNGSSNAGTNMGLTTIVELIDPTPNDVNEVNKVKVIIMQNGTELASFISDKWILENFNIIMNRGPIVQHEYVVAKTHRATFSTEYLHAVHTSDALKFYAKLLYGNSYGGVRVELLKTSVRGDASEFQLNGDRLYMSPLVNAVDSVNAYTDRYSNVLGIEIKPSTTGYPLPTNSNAHRNICPTKFRGYKNDQAQIDVFRTATHIKMVFGDKFQDDMNTHSTSNVSTVWKNRGSTDGPYNVLQANDIRFVVTGGVQPDNMGIVMNSVVPSIGSLGLKVTPNYSMFPTSITALYTIPITVTAASYTKTITNTLDASMEFTSDANSTVFDVLLHRFQTFDIVATRIKVVSDEKFKFEYTIPPLQVYHSPQYVGDPRSINNWIQIVSYSDDQLRTGQTVSSPNFAGVVNIKRELIHVSSHTKYGILPRPTAFAEAYAITDLSNVTLPSSLSVFQRKKYYCDIDITTTGYDQGLEPSSQQHNPFAKAQSNGVNAVNAVPDGVGLNNLTLGFNVAKYLNLRYTQPVNFSFDITSNLLKISNGVGLSASAGDLVEIFDGYISELATVSNWHHDLQSTINNEFVGKKWNINTRQLHSVIANFVNAPIDLTNNYLYVNGITSFALGNYYLDLNLLDSVVASFYSFDRSYNTTTKTVDVKFAKYSTAGVINWATSEQFTKCENFRPLITKKETFTLPVQIVNTLTRQRFNVEDLIKTAVNQAMTSTTIGWTEDPDYVPTYSPTRICPLSIPGSVLLHEIMHVNKEVPCRVIGFNRPSIVLIKSADGSTVTKITPDGIIITNKMITEILQLEPTNFLPPGTQDYIGGEAFYGNINPSGRSVRIVPN
jgi:hypothetical protein